MSEINRELLKAVQCGELESVKALLNQNGLHNTEGYGYVLLRNSLIHNKTEITKLLLRSGSRVNSKRSKRIPSDTPLHIAVQNDDIEIVEMLLNYCADIDAQNEICFTPLLGAVSMNSEKIVELLINRGSNINYDNKYGISPLHVAVKCGSYKITEKLLQSGAKVNRTLSILETPLHYAVEYSGDFLIVDLLLKHGANVDSKTNKGLTPMHLASTKDNVEIIKLLLKGNADINARSDNMLTPLYLAVQYSKINAAKFLMEHGANIDAESENGKTILHLAVTKGLSPLVEEILKYCPDIDNTSNKNAIKIISKESYTCNNLTIVQHLLNYGFSLDLDDVSVLLENAIKKGCIQIIEHLIKHGLDLACSKNCIIFAAKNKNADIAKFLLTNGADVNATDEAGKPAIYYSTENSDVIMTKLLLDNGANIQSSPELLRVATKKLCKEIVEILLKFRVDIEASDKHGRTALHLTALCEYDEFMGSLLMNVDNSKNEERGEIARMLLSMGANVNAKTIKNELTTLQIACQKGFTNVVEVLLEYKADVNCVVQDCSTLLIAAQQGNTSILKMLIENGANVNSKRKNGDTALHIVARTCHSDTLELLVKNGADVYSINNRAVCALHEASQQGNYEAVCILLQYGSPIDSKDIDGKTALHKAIGATEKEIVKLLLASGADINILTNDNRSAVDIGYFELARIKSSNVYHYELDEDYFDDYDDTSYDYSDSQDIIDILELHVVMLKTANLNVIDQNLDYVMYSENGCFAELYTEDCEDEIKNLKLQKIANNKISFYDILTKDGHSLANYARNENIVQVFESDHYKTMFPIYAPIIERNFEKGIRRRLLLDRSQEFFKCYFDLPYDCSDHMLRYLSDIDLENIVNVAKTLNIV